MPYRNMLQLLMSKREVVGCVILDPNGHIWWHTGVFPQAKDRLLDPYHLFSEWVTFPSDVEIAGGEYQSIINSYPTYWILSNTQRMGSIILQLNKRLGYYFLCYLHQDQDPLGKQKDIEEMADSFGISA